MCAFRPKNPVVAEKLGIKYDPPTISMFYRRNQNDRKQRMYQILLNGLINLPTSDLIAQKLFIEHSLWLNENHVEFDQIKHLVEILLSKVKWQDENDENKNPNVVLTTPPNLQRNQLKNQQNFATNEKIDIGTKFNFTPNITKHINLNKPNKRFPNKNKLNNGIFIHEGEYADYNDNTSNDLNKSIDNIVIDDNQEFYNPMELAESRNGLNNNVNNQNNEFLSQSPIQQTYNNHNKGYMQDDNNEKIIGFPEGSKKTQLKQQLFQQNNNFNGDVEMDQFQLYGNNNINNNFKKNNDNVRLNDFIENENSQINIYDQQLVYQQQPNQQQVQMNTNNNYFYQQNFQQQQQNQNIEFQNLNQGIIQNEDFNEYLNNDDPIDYQQIEPQQQRNTHNQFYRKMKQNNNNKNQNQISNQSIQGTQGGRPRRSNIIPENSNNSPVNEQEKFQVQQQQFLENEVFGYPENVAQTPQKRIRQKQHNQKYQRNKIGFLKEMRNDRDTFQQSDSINQKNNNNNNVANKIEIFNNNDVEEIEII